MVLNRMSKGAKEIDIAATLEHIRDQRVNMVKTKVNTDKRVKTRILNDLLFLFILNIKLISDHPI